MGESQGADAAAAGSSNKAKKKSQRRSKGKMKKMDELRSEPAVVGQVQLLCSA